MLKANLVKRFKFLNFVSCLNKMTFSNGFSRIILRYFNLLIRQNIFQILILANYQYANSLLKRFLYTPVSMSDFFFYKKLILTGLGFKMFFYKKKVYLLLGYSHYILVPIPSYVKLLFFKKRVYIFAPTKLLLNNFVAIMLKIRHISYYKHKGLYF